MTTIGPVVYEPKGVDDMMPLARGTYNGLSACIHAGLINGEEEADLHWLAEALFGAYEEGRKSLEPRIASIEAQYAALWKIAAAGRDYGAGPLDAEVQRRIERAEALDEISRLGEEFDAAGEMLKGAKW